MVTAVDSEPVSLRRPSPSATSRSCGTRSATTPRAHGFTAENGAAQLRLRFAYVEVRHVEWHIQFTDRAQLQAIVGATIRRSHLAPGVLRLGMPSKATARHAIL
jgi:hypothetical protein